MGMSAYRTCFSDFQMKVFQPIGMLFFSYTVFDDGYSSLVNAAGDGDDDASDMNVYTTLQLLVQYVDVMCSVGLATEQNHALLSQAVCGFFQLVSVITLCTCTCTCTCTYTSTYMCDVFAAVL